jgi:putative oxidoreductase
VTGAERGWAVARGVYGLFFAGTGCWIFVAMATGLLSAPVQPTPEAAAFMRALGEARFVDPLLASSFLLGGGLLLFDRTAPAGLALLAPSVAVILLFHLFLSGQYVWGPFVALWFLILAWHYRRAFLALCTHSAGEPTGG